MGFKLSKDRELTIIDETSFLSSGMHLTRSWEIVKEEWLIIDVSDGDDGPTQRPTDRKVS